MKTAPAKTPETIMVTSRRISCDGGAAESQGALGHPLVYLHIGADGTVDCGYCDRHFVLDKNAAHHGDH
jgi:uncharacterized Zn-finger protein